MELVARCVLATNEPSNVPCGVMIWWALVGIKPDASPCDNQPMFCSRRMPAPLRVPLCAGVRSFASSSTPAHNPPVTHSLAPLFAFWCACAFSVNVIQPVDATVITPREILRDYMVRTCTSKRQPT